MTAPNAANAGATAAFTIATASRLPAARVLARTYREAHPSHLFFVVLIDDPGDPVNVEGLQVVHLREIGLPSPDVFPYQFDQSELCAVLKPFCIRHLLATQGLDRLAYLDSDIMVVNGLDEVWSKLQTNNVVLTPYARKPFHDKESPSDASILRSGVFNLGFIAVKRSAVTTAMLDWWCENLYTNPVDVCGHGGHPEQKWIDLAPVYFDDVHALMAPGYNVAYWNLHERILTCDHNAGFLVDGAPLAFFHFSGYLPETPDRLSVYQSRHWLEELPAVRLICDSYAQKLREECKSSAMVDAPRRLTNGVPVTRLVNAVVRQCTRHGVALPSPRDDADGFCQFLTTPNPAVYGADVAPVVTAILNLRQDVDAAFPNARHNKNDDGMRRWLVTYGDREEGLGPLLEGYGDSLGDTPPLATAIEIYERRVDLRDAFPAIWTSDSDYQQYGEWLARHGKDEEGADDHLVDDYRSARRGFYKVLDRYFNRPDLLAKFLLLNDGVAIAGVMQAIAGETRNFPYLCRRDLIAFEQFAAARREDMVLSGLRYNPYVREAIGGLPSLFNSTAIKDFLAKHRADDCWPRVHELLLSGDWIAPNAQYRASVQTPYCPSAENGQSSDSAISKATESLASGHPESLNHHLFGAWKKRLIDDCTRELTRGINLYGPLNDPTGMGESGRSMVRTLSAAGIPCRAMSFPGTVPEAVKETLPRVTELYGDADEGMDTNLIIANADASENVRRWLPTHVMRDRCNLAYWVWETEELPLRFKVATEGLDAILTPSNYSAGAIRKIADIPVHTVPHPLDFDRLAVAKPSRAFFGLPEGIPLFGFFFDSNSIIERKNPAAVISAFRLAFGERKDVGLVLKVSSPTPGRYEYDSLRARAGDLNVFWIERSMSHDATMDLMASLSVYVSMHRSEGFGLTLAEAMALQKPVIATGYSGNLDFMDSTVALLVDYRICATDRPHGPYPVGSRWAEPSVEHCAALMRMLATSNETNTLGEAGKRRVKEVLHPIVVGQRMTDVLAQVQRLYARRSSGIDRLRPAHQGSPLF